MTEIIKLTPLQMDALTELGTISSGGAAIALSQMIKRRINMAVTQVQIIPSEEFIRFVGGGQMLSVAVYVELLGDLQGGVIVIFRREDALKLANFLLPQERSEAKAFSELEQSALKEVGNILTGSYINSLSLVLQYKLVHSVPHFAFDQMESLVHSVFYEIMKPLKGAVSLVTEFIESNSKTKGHLVLLPTEESLGKILKGLKVSK